MPSVVRGKRRRNGAGLSLPELRKYTKRKGRRRRAVEPSVKPAVAVPGHGVVRPGFDRLKGLVDGALTACVPWRPMVQAAVIWFERGTADDVTVQFETANGVVAVWKPLAKVFAPSVGEPVHEPSPDGAVRRAVAMCQGKGD